MDYYEHIESTTWLIEMNYDEADGSVRAYQGTGFMTRLGIITNEHVIQGRSTEIRVSNRRLSPKQFKVKILQKDSRRDLAILEIQAALDFPVLELENNYHKPVRKSKLTIAGYPNYGVGSNLSILDTNVVSTRMRSSVERIQIASGIIFGMSGGPAIDPESNKVIGVLVRGGTDQTDSTNHENEIIPINELNELIESLT